MNRGHEGPPQQDMGQESREQEYMERMRAALNELREANGKFRVERSETTPAGVPKAEFDWQIREVEGDTVVVGKTEDNKMISKNVPLEQFAEWQAAWLNNVRNAVDADGERRGIWKRTDARGGPGYERLQEEFYAKVGISPELKKLGQIGYEGVLRKLRE
ncbi:MAG: hypothetical protein HY459_03790 [Parcubacteria group bacterium]|nr:hypothetical protein [Parcubacteria group bacterium]